MHWVAAFALLAVVVADDPAVPATAGKKPPGPKLSELRAVAKKIADARPGSDAALMATALIKGGSMGPGAGWFAVPPSIKYPWPALAKQLGGDPAKGIAKKDFRGPPHWFAGLDRDGSGRILAGDFDWSPSSPFVEQQDIAATLFQALDKNGDGRISPEEWQAFFAHRGAKPSLTPDDLRAGLFPPAPETAAVASGTPPQMILMGFLGGELGAMEDGPRAGEKAPDFELPAGAGKIRLSQIVGKRPVVLVFGSFT